MGRTYVLVRQDLSPSQQAVQACHACLEFGKHFPWQGDHPHLVYLGVPDEDSLKRWLETTREHSNRVAEFREPDLDHSLTAFAAGFQGRAQKMFASLSLVKFEIPQPQKKETIMSSTTSTFTPIQSRWGFHPCSREHYKKLKRLNWLVLQCRRQDAAYRRWERKAPQNRRIFIGSKYGGVITPAVKRATSKCWRAYKPAPKPVMAEIYPLQMEYIERDYRSARYPQVEAEVKPLIFTAEQVDAYLQTLELWFANARAGVTNPAVK